MPAVVGVNVYVLGVVGFVLAPLPVPSGMSMLFAVMVSPEPAAKVAVMVLDCPMRTVEPRDEVMVAAGLAGAEMESVAGHEAVAPLTPYTVPLYEVADVGFTNAEPLALGVTAPMVARVNEVALAEVQRTVVPVPYGAGFLSKVTEQVGAGQLETGGVVAEQEPLHWMVPVFV